MYKHTYLAQIVETTKRIQELQNELDSRTTKGKEAIENIKTHAGQMVIVRLMQMANELQELHSSLPDLLMKYDQADRHRGRLNNKQHRRDSLLQGMQSSNERKIDQGA